MVIQDLIDWHYKQSCHSYESAANAPPGSRTRREYDVAGAFHDEAVDYLERLKVVAADLAIDVLKG